MTYLQLINSVLTRLREEEIDSTKVNSDPYLRSIGAHVNDAKRRVEDAWQWGALRSTDSLAVDENQLHSSGPDIALPGSLNTQYIIKNISVFPNDTGAFSFDGTRSPLRWTNVDRMRQRYATPSAVSQGRPQEFAVTGVAGDAFGVAHEGEIKITLWPRPTNDSGVGDYWISVDRVAHQVDLVAADDKLKVPSLPVYTLASALASRERGEVGGAPTSELFAIADGYLADAIAVDSALYANELDWWADTNLHNTNVRFA